MHICISYYFSCKILLKPLYFSLLSCSYPDDQSFASKIGLPPDDVMLLTAQGLWLTPIPIFLYLTAYAITELHGYVLYGVIAAFAKVFGMIFGS